MCFQIVHAFFVILLALVLRGVVVDIPIVMDVAPLLVDSVSVRVLDDGPGQEIRNRRRVVRDCLIFGA